MLFQIKRAKPLLGTYFEISVCAQDRNRANKSVSEAFKEALRLEQLLSFYQNDSDISRLNRARINSTISVAKETSTLLRFCAKLSDESKGLFNIATYEKLSNYNSAYRIQDESIEVLRDIKVDLGGVAKGYIVDKVVEQLLLSDMSDIIVNAGGDIRVARSSGAAITIRDPRQPTNLSQPIKSLVLTEGAIATSAPYFSFSRLYDPRNLTVCKDRHSVSVISGSCLVADALTKIIALSRDSSKTILERYHSTAIVYEVGNNNKIKEVLIN